MSRGAVFQLICLLEANPWLSKETLKARSVWHPWSIDLHRVKLYTTRQDFMQNIYSLDWSEMCYVNTVIVCYYD